MTRNTRNDALSRKPTLVKVSVEHKRGYSNASLRPLYDSATSPSLYVGKRDRDIRKYKLCVLRFEKYSTDASNNASGDERVSQRRHIEQETNCIEERCRIHRNVVPITVLMRKDEIQLSKDQLSHLKMAFDAFDPDKKGCIGTDKVGTIFDMLGHEVKSEELSAIILEVDTWGTGELKFDEFCQVASHFLEEDTDAEAVQEELREAFRLYDKEGNGYITTDVFRDILHELDDALSPEELDMIIDEVDADGSGTVDFDEFMEVMTG
ncbi:troponin C, isoallergen Bla g 6.0101-like [Polyergus mexicanus]|uniref:troponin C, isoallergen Bla g 6.0101-like n=1 Tax=Polyergus mexicanus TaxID=615972 RepID=UPI0038B688F1